ncbi:MAG: calcium-binding protein [Planctomycetes bacterium]|nr:calcium-binding protein [Planctomycetota bacterium]
MKTQDVWWNGWVASFVALISLADMVSAQVITTVISKGPTGTLGNNISFGSEITPDGRYILFNSGASNLGPNDINLAQDVYVWDRVQQAMQLVSLKSDGTQSPNANVGGGGMTSNGRFLVLGTTAKLTPDDTNSATDMYVRDLVLGTTTLVSQTPAGVVSSFISVYGYGVSDDGRFVVFQTKSNDFGNRDTDFDDDVYWRDTLLGITKRVSVSSHGVDGNNDSTVPRISRDGRVVMFESYATNLVRGDTNNALDVFAHDVVSGRTLRLDLAPGGVQALNGGSGSIKMSKDNRYVVFGSSAKNLDPLDQNNWTDIFLRDNATGKITLVSRTPSGFSGNGLSLNPAISEDGRYVVFESVATDLVTPDANGNVWDIFRFDSVTGEVRLVSQSSTGVQGDSYSLGASITADGRFVTYYSYSTNLIPNDNNNNRDVFLTELLPGP